MSRHIDSNQQREENAQLHDAMRVMLCVISAFIIVVGCITLLAVNVPSLRMVTTWPIISNIIAGSNSVFVVMVCAALGVVCISLYDHYTGLSTTKLYEDSCYSLVLIAIFMLIGLSDSYMEAPISDRQRDAATMTIAEWTARDAVNEDGLRTIIEGYNPDVIILPETGRQPVVESMVNSIDSGSDRGHTVVQAAETDVPTIAIVSDKLRPYHVATTAQTTTNRAFIIQSASAKTAPWPDVIGVSVQPPQLGNINRWSSDLSDIVEYANATQRPTIFTGNFNANMKQGRLPELRSSYGTCSPDGLSGGTWPRGNPISSMRNQVDQILIPTHGVNMVGCTSGDPGMSSHTFLVTTIQY